MPAIGGHFDIEHVAARFMLLDAVNLKRMERERMGERIRARQRIGKEILKPLD
jgi:hypothetical protein